MLIIDTHAHIYSPDEAKYPAIEDPLRPPAGKGSLEDLKQESSENGVSAICAIQTSTFYRFDNRYILDSSKANPDWVAGVCTLNPDDPRSPSLLVRNVREYGIRGMRSIAAADKRLDHPGVRALWKTALDEGIVINILTGPHLADQVDRLLGQFPALRVVLDHCFNPKAGPGLEATVEKVLYLSRHENLHAKLTFVPTGERDRLSLRRPARRLHAHRQGLRSRALRVGQRLSQRAVDPQGQLRRAPEDLHRGAPLQRTGTRGRAGRHSEAPLVSEPIACISHHPTVEAHDTTARTSLRLLAVLDVLFKYACARQAARASS